MWDFLKDKSERKYSAWAVVALLCLCALTQLTSMVEALSIVSAWRASLLNVGGIHLV